MARRDGEKKLRMRGHPDWSLELLPLWLYEEGMKDVLKLLAGALANFAAISFGIAVYEGQSLGFVLGGYSLFVAAILVWRAK